MTKYILIGGYIYGAEDGGKAFCEELVRNISHRPVKILDCLFARPEDTWGESFKTDCEFFAKNIDDCTVEIASVKDFTQQVEDADVIFFRGGTPRELISSLGVSGGWIDKLEGKVVAGSSGGADALCKYYGVGKTMNIGEGLDLLPVKIIPHWKSESRYTEGLAIDWDALLEKLKAHKEDLEVLTVKEGEFIVIER